MNGIFTKKSEKKESIIALLGIVANTRMEVKLKKILNHQKILIEHILKLIAFYGLFLLTFFDIILLRPRLELLVRVLFFLSISFFN
ncbi:TPA_asm: hypothetical protein CBHJFHIM_00058 [Methanobrevibacter gottschalkii virus vir075]